LADNGRSYTLALHGLPSARSYGEPLSSSMSIDANAHIIAAVIIEPERRYLIAADNGYGFLIAGSELTSKTKSGKTLISPGGDSRAITLQALPDGEADILAITNEGRVALIPAEEIPELAKGKGSQTLAIAKKTYDEHGIRLAHILGTDHNRLPPFSYALMRSCRTQCSGECKIDASTAPRQLRTQATPVRRMNLNDVTPAALPALRSHRHGEK